MESVQKECDLMIIGRVLVLFTVGIQVVLGEHE
jgi:hypothetical protein